MASAAEKKSEDTATTLPQLEFGPQTEGESNKRKAEPMDPPTNDGQDASASATENAEESSGQLLLVPVAVSSIGCSFVAGVLKK